MSRWGCLLEVYIFSLYKRLSTMMMLLNILISSFQAREGFLEQHSRFSDI